MNQKKTGQANKAGIPILKYATGPAKPVARGQSIGKSIKLSHNLMTKAIQHGSKGPASAINQ